MWPPLVRGPWRTRGSGPFHLAAYGKTTNEGPVAERAAGRSTGPDGRVRPCRSALFLGPMAFQCLITSRPRASAFIPKKRTQGRAAFVSTSSISLVTKISRQQKQSLRQCPAFRRHLNPCARGDPGCFDIRTARRTRAIGSDRASREAWNDCLRQRHRTNIDRHPAVVFRASDRVALHRAGKADAKRLRREFQRSDARRAAQ